MPEIGLANDVTIEYGEGDVNIGSGYKFTTDVPELGEFATRGTKFKLTTRKDDEESEGEYIFKFITQNKVRFQLVEQTFFDYIDSGVIVNLD